MIPNINFNVRKRLTGGHGAGITDINPQQARKTHHSAQHSSPIGWRKEKGPLCATSLTLRVIQGKDPSSIQSFIRFQQEERSNSAHHLPLSSHTFGRTRASLPSHPGCFSSLSPGLRRPAPLSVLTSDPEYSRWDGVPKGVQGGIYTQGGIPGTMVGRVLCASLSLFSHGG